MLKHISQIRAQQDQHAGEVDKATVVRQVIFVAHQDPAGILQPRVQPLDLPAPAIPAERAAVLRPRPRPIALVRRDELDARGGEAGIQRVGVIGPIPDQPLRGRGDEPLGHGGFGERYFVGRSARHVRCPPRAPFFRDHEGAVDKALRQVQAAARSKILGERPEHALKGAGLHPQLKATVTGLIGWVPGGQVVPRRAGPQDPQDPVEHIPRVAPRTTPPVR